MKRLTRRQALQACIKIWNFMVKNPHLTKTQAIEKLNLENKYRNDCPCCDYSDNHKKDYCSTNCIIKWGSNEYRGCSQNFSPWILYITTFINTTENLQARINIVKLAKQALAKLPSLRSKL